MQHTHTPFSFPASEGIGIRHKTLSNQIWADDTEKQSSAGKCERRPFEVKVLQGLRVGRFKEAWFVQPQFQKSWVKHNENRML